MTLRVATPEDVGSVSRLHADGDLLTLHGDVLGPVAWERLQREKAALWGELLSTPPAGQRVFVVDDGHVAGFTSAGPDPSGDGAGGKVFALFVARESWGAGYGFRLLDRAETHLAAHFHHASLWVVHSNVRARRLYERCGWHVTGTEKLHRGVRFVRYSKCLQTWRDEEVPSLAPASWSPDPRVAHNRQVPAPRRQSCPEFGRHARAACQALDLQPPGPQAAAE